MRMYNLISKFFLTANQKGIFAACSKAINYFLRNRNFQAPLAKVAAPAPLAKVAAPQTSLQEMLLGN